MTAPITQIACQVGFSKLDDYSHAFVINGTKFAVFTKALENQTAITLDLSDFTVIFLSPLVAETDITVKAVAVVAMSTIHAKTGKVSISTSDKMMFMMAKIIGTNNEFVAQKSMIIRGADPTQHKLISDVFKSAVDNENDDDFIDGLTGIYDAMVNVEDDENVEENSNSESPEEELESEELDLATLFNFFNIPIEIPN